MPAKFGKGRMPKPVRPLSSEQVEREIAELEAESQRRRYAPENMRTDLGPSDKESEYSEPEIQEFMEGPVSYRFKRFGKTREGRGSLIGRSNHHEQTWIRGEDGQAYALYPHEWEREKE